MDPLVPFVTGKKTVDCHEELLWRGVGKRIYGSEQMGGGLK
jgi:hypothetical protein